MELDEPSGSTALYSPITIDHFQHPRNVGRMADADAVGNVNDADSETTIWVFVKRRGGSIERATFRAFGCSACIAAGSVATELITGQPLGEAARLSGEAIERALGGLPAPKRYCAELAARAVQRAVGVLGVRAI